MDPSTVTPPTRKIPLNIFGLLFIILGLIAAIVLIGNQQLLNQSASTTSMACTPETNQVINFESVPGLTNQAELDPINTQYQYITFTNGPRYDAKTGQNLGACSTQYPLLAKRGSPRVAFLNDATGVADAPNAAANAGTWFLTDDGIVGGQPCSLVVNYSIPTTQLGFELIDIDNAEGWQIEPYDTSGNLITPLVKTVTYQSASTGDSVGTPITIVSSDALPIGKIIIKAYGQSGGWGLAFDNFSTFCAVPPSPTPSPTATPNVPPVCRAINLYTSSWTPISTSQALQLTPPQTIYIAVSGDTGGFGTFDKARFSVNGGTWIESTTLNQFGEYYIPFTIVDGMTNLSVAAQVHHVETDQWY